MTREISQHELRNDSGSILRAVQAGEDFIVTRNGTALAELRPLRRRRFVSQSDLLAAARQWAPINASTFRADIDEIVDQSLERDLSGRVPRPDSGRTRSTDAMGIPGRYARCR
jgi:prevent-host-death family protein